MSNQTGILDLLSPPRRPAAPGRPAPPVTPAPRPTTGILELLPPTRTQEVTVPGRPTVETIGYRAGIGEDIYRRSPDAIVRAIREAEGVPSYGNMALARRYGGHQRVPEAEGRAATRRLVDLRYQEWVQRGRPDDYLDYLRDRYAPIGAANDPRGINRFWLPNVLRTLGVQRVVEEPRPQISPAQGLPETADAEARRRGIVPTGPSRLTPRERAEVEARTTQLRRDEELARQMARLRRVVPQLPESALVRVEAESRRTGLSPEDLLSLGLIQPGIIPAFVREFLRVLPGQERFIRGLEERRARAEAPPEVRAEIGARLPAAVPAEILRELPQRRPPIGERVAGVFGTLTGFAALAPALEATIGARFGPIAARGLARSLAAAASEGVAYGIVDTVSNNYDEIKAMTPQEATQFVATRAGITGAEFAVFAAGFRAVFGLIRRGILTKQAIDEVAGVLRGEREVPLVSPPRRPGEAPPLPSPIEEIRARRAREIAPLAAERAGRAERLSAAEAEAAARREAASAVEIPPPPRPLRVVPGRIVSERAGRREALRAAEAETAAREAVRAEAAGTLEARRARIADLMGEREGRFAARARLRSGEPAPAVPTVPPETPPRPTVEPARGLEGARPAEAPPVSLEPPVAPGPPREPVVVEEIRRRRRREGVFTVAQVQGDATAAPIEQRAQVRTGRRTAVSTPEGTEAEAQYAVVDAAAPTISHTETATGVQANPAYPWALQRRQRERIVTQDWLKETSERLRPEWLGHNPLGNFGAPVMGRDGVIEAGNGRILLLRRLYRTGHANADAYKTWLRDNAAEFGVTPEDVAAFRNPVLVRIRRGTVPDRTRWTEELNVEPQVVMSATEVALADADRLTPELLNLVRPSALTSAENRPFVRRFIDQIVPTTQRGRVVDAEGNLSQEGIIRIRNALFARAYGTDELATLTRITEATDDATGNLSRALIGAAPKFAQIRQGMERGDLWPSLDVVGRNILGDAVNTYARLKEPGAPVDVPTFLQQGVLIAEADIAPEARELLRAFHQYRRSGQQTQAFLEGAADEILNAGSPRQMGLTEAPQAPPISRMLEAGHRRVAEATQPELFTAEPPKITPQQIASNLDEFLSLPQTARKAISDALDQAVGGRQVRTIDQAILAGRRAYDIYQKDPTPGKPALTREWFEQNAIARYFGEPGAIDAATMTDPRVPLDERLNAATRNPEATSRRFRRKKPPADQPHEKGPDASGQGGFLRLADLGTMTDPARAQAETARGLWRGWVRQASTVVGKMGREGTDLVRRMRGADKEATLAAGEAQANIERTWGGPIATTDEAMERIRAQVEATADVTLTARERKLLEAIQPYLNRVVPRARQAKPAAEDMPLLPPTELGLPPQRQVAEGLDVGFLPNYWPIMVDDTKIMRKPSEAVRAIMERTGADAARAEEILNRFLRSRRSGRPFGNLERRREDWAPYAVRLPALTELTRYITGAERRIAQAKWFGANDEIVNAHIAAIRLRNPQDAAFTTSTFDAYVGNRPKEAYLEGLAREITGLQAGAKMVLSVLSNAGQTINIALVADLTTFARAWRRILSSDQMTTAEARDFATRTGAVIETAMREIRAWSGIEEGARLGELVGERTITRTGFLSVEGGNRIVSAVAGRDWVISLASQYGARMTGGRGIGPQTWWRRHRVETLERHLRKMDIDPATLADRARTDPSKVSVTWDQAAEGQGLLTKDDIRLAGLRMVEESQFRPTAIELPLFWDSPWGRVATQFKRFAYKQGQLVWRSVFVEALRGNVKPMIVFLSVFPIVGEAIADARLLIRRGISAGFRALPAEGPGAAIRDMFGVLRERPRGILPRMVENLAYVGGVGLASDLIRALEARAPDEAVASFLSGPTGSDVYDIVRAAGGTLRDMEKIVAGEPTQLGGPRRLARKAVQLTVTPALAGAFGLPGAAAAKTIESAQVFRTPQARQRELARRIADAVARGDRATARKLQQRHKDEFGRAADIVAILRARRQRERRRKP